ncbi:MAG: Bug family tripartite tricarboxylate transporter substrate binding protein [Burkholderiales bacterium]
MTRNKPPFASLVFLSSFFLAGHALGQSAASYPSKPIRIVVPFAPGGTTDIVARSVGADMTKTLGQAVSIENRAGAGGNLGSDVVAKAAPDGYTLLVGAVSPQAINVTLYPNMPYDVMRDFEHISLLAAVPNLLEVHPSVPVKTVRELIDYAKARPGKLAYASSGSGPSIHLSAELFKTMTGVDMLHIPYKGSAPAVADLIAGQVQLMFDNLPSSIQQVRAGKLRAIAVTTARRSPVLPDIPTIAESGLPGYEASSWFGMHAPAKTSKDIVNRLYATVAKSLRTPEMIERLTSQGADPVGNTPEQFTEFVREEIAKWAKVVKASGAKVE